MSGRGMVGAAMAFLEAREALAEAREAQRALVTNDAGSAVARLAREALRRANEERLARALQWLGAHLLDALESGQVLELSRSLESELLSPVQGDDLPDEPEPQVEARGEDTIVTGDGAGVAKDVVSPPVVPVVIDDELIAQLNAKIQENQGRPKETNGRAVGRDVALVAADELPIAVLNALMQAGRVLGSTPGRLSGGNAIEDEVKRLEEALRTTLGHWGKAGKEVDHALTSWVAARARAAQDAVAALLGEARAERVGRRIDTIVSALGRHTKETWPGKVHGLARHHHPRGQSWSEDARGCERRARELLPLGAVVDEDELELEAERAKRRMGDDRLRCLWEGLRDGRDGSELISELWQLVVMDGLIGRTDPRLVGLVRELVERETEPLEALAELGLGVLGLAELERSVRDELMDQDGEDEIERWDLPEDWPGYAVTRGVAAAIVGGVPRPSRVEALRKCFELASLEWIPNACDRPLDSIVHRMRSGSLELVIVLSQLVSHNASDRLFENRDSGCRVVLADSYGVGQIRLAIERFAASAMR